MLLYYCMELVYDQVLYIKDGKGSPVLDMSFELRANPGCLAVGSQLT